ncbi:alcohol dehydrogenase [Mytilinidion resinicola]|uniref:Alcohol dehydrogenase n=1 Tax=Mytilinidion resinicola TaxID=574789 RepID=A0A6A6YYK5_9PEZI|nr:alcohol dehydrogenase [Mytilinidion resinicola]KAF2814002.1 alcohol dehydrogenase [Mytilinidion resinicola]
MSSTATVTQNGSAKTMKSQIVVKQDVPIPTPGPNDLLVKLSASSLCMSDMAAYAGHLGERAPVCLGHEPVGIVVEAGAGVVGFAKGDRVGFMPFKGMCEDCEECLSGQSRFCEKKVGGMTELHGGFSEYAIAAPLSTVKIPEGLTDEEAAPLLCAGVTAYNALKVVAKEQPGGTPLNIIGVGGVGHLAVAYAKAFGYRVTAFDIAEDKLELAKKYGATKGVNTLTLKDEDIVKTQTTIVISGAAPAYALAVKTTKNHGRIIAVGVPHAPLTFNVLDLILREVSIVPICQGSKQDLDESLKMAAEYGIKPTIQIKKIGQLYEGFQSMAKGEVTGRLVYRFD